MVDYPRQNSGPSVRRTPDRKNLEELFNSVGLIDRHILFVSFSVLV